MRLRFSGSVALGGALLLAGCGATERSVAVPYSIALDVAPDVNPDINRKPSPIVLKVFQLKTASAFESADFFSLQDKPQSVLGADLLGVDRIILRPGDARTLHYRGNVDAGAIGIVAEYRVLEKNRWRMTVPLPRAKQLNLYRFWQTSPSEMKLQVAVKNGGIGLGGDSRVRR
ncbi:type VI secretion system lipoprotein TssJ [Burkholderia thailandensis]|uniref:Lipoprotein, putative n=1 Tax=Burkholderia thailandensis (strain ATCC 700388 / DSM 13276 / CCUG 48851 / CIP 106301 / E264) TaxID=271848 RepID=Q2T8P6_BURTA|nr:type VI secretion system lipoprotein TssJ [Burkholderia thailandensis]ABC34811.1 lipoprotein, putative [Burkholderia thailandensis E264]AHI75318.1 type VI secretion lipofamily protein [Burkholderia thailandensis 2002721723]AHI80982.1 type VI secretion lipofamily protein [Burkholderia thailandensis E444]AIC91229.1 type VI secretion lipofamily protein [Burkholderia thailandensis USAMRU Malaysia \